MIDACGTSAHLSMLVSLRGLRYTRHCNPYRLSPTRGTRDVRMHGGDHGRGVEVRHHCRGLRECGSAGNTALRRGLLLLAVLHPLYSFWPAFWSPWMTVDYWLAGISLQNSARSLAFRLIRARILSPRYFNRTPIFPVDTTKRMVARLAASFFWRLTNGFMRSVRHKQPGYLSPYGSRKSFLHAGAPVNSAPDASHGHPKDAEASQRSGRHRLARREGPRPR